MPRSLVPPAVTASRPGRASLILATLLACHPPAVPAPPPVAPAVPAPCADHSPTPAPPPAPFPCVPAPGRAGWVTDLRPPTPAPIALRPARPKPALLLFGLVARRMRLAMPQDALVTLAGADATHWLAAPTVDALTRRLAALPDETGPDTHLRVLIHGVAPLPGDPWGCVPLADGCFPLTALRTALAAVPARSRVVVIEAAADPTTAAAAFADGSTGVVAFDRDERAAAHRFWTAPDLDGDGVLALHERHAAARPFLPVLDPSGKLAWDAREATPPFVGDVARPTDLAGLQQLARSLAPGQLLLVHLAPRGCPDCAYPHARNFIRQAADHRGLRFARMTDADAIFTHYGLPLSLIEPAIAYFDHEGHLFGLADDFMRPVGSLGLALVPFPERFDLYESLLLQSDLERLKLAAAALVHLEGDNDDALARLARRIHADSEPELVLAVIAAIARAKWVGHVAAPEILSHLDHPDERVRIAASEALMTIQADRDDILCPLISAIPDPHPIVRANIRLSLFGLLRDAGPGVPAMASLLAHPDPAVRRAAVEAFAEFNAAELAAPALPQLLAIVRGREPDELRRLAMFAITRMLAAAEPALPQLATILTADPDPEVRALVARVAEHIGPPAACLRPALERSARDDVPLVRQRALAALAHLGPE